MSGTAFNLIFLVILTAMNGFCCFAEVAVVASRKSRLQTMLNNGDRRAQHALDVQGNPTVALATTQTGITAIQVLSGIIGAHAFAEPCAELFMMLHVPEATASFLGTTVVFVVVTYFEIVFGELFPKRIGQVDPEGYLCGVATTMKFLGLIARPFIWLLSITTNACLKICGIRSTATEAVSAEEINALIDEGTAAGVVEENERAMVQNVFRLDDRTVASVMVPRNEIEWIDLEEPKEESIRQIFSSKHARLVVAAGDLDNIKGLCSIRKVLKSLVEKDAPDFENSVTEPVYVPETLSVMEMLEQFKATDAPCAFAVDEYGSVVGMVTLRDVVEAIAGEFKPHSNDDAMAVSAPDGSYDLDGMIAIPELKDTLQLKSLPQEDRGAYNTLSGLTMLMLERLPRLGDTFMLDDWVLEVTEMDGRRAARVQARKKSAPATGVTTKTEVKIVVTPNKPAEKPADKAADKPEAE